MSSHLGLNISRDPGSYIPNRPKQPTSSGQETKSEEASDITLKLSAKTPIEQFNIALTTFIQNLLLSSELPAIKAQETSIQLIKSHLEFIQEMLLSIDTNPHKVAELARSIKTRLDQSNSVIIPLYSGNTPSLFIHVTREGFFLFNTLADVSNHPKIIEKDVDTFTKKPKINIKIQHVLFMEKIDVSLLDNPRFFETLITISLKSKEMESPAILKRFVYDALPKIAKSSWECKEDSSFAYKKENHAPPFEKIIKNLFYHLLLEGSSSQEETKNAYKIIKLLSKKSSSLVEPRSLCKEAIKLEEQLPTALFRESLQLGYDTLGKSENILTHKFTLETHSFPQDFFTFPRNDPLNTKRLGCIAARGNVKGSQRSHYTGRVTLLPPSIITPLSNPLEFLADLKKRSCSIKALPSLKNHIYWDSVPQKHIPDILSELFRLIQYFERRSNSFENSLLKWNLYAIGELLALKALENNPFQNHPISRTLFIDFIKDPRNATDNPLLERRFEELIEFLLPEGFNIHDPSCALAESALFTIESHSKSNPSEASRFFKQYLPKGTSYSEQAIQDILKESTSPDTNRIPLAVKLLQQLSWAQLSWAVHIVHNSPNKEITIWRFQYIGAKVGAADALSLCFDGLALPPTRISRIGYQDDPSLKKPNQYTFNFKRHAESPAKVSGFFYTTQRHPAPQIAKYYAENQTGEQILYIWADPRDSINRFIGYFLENSINKFSNDKRESWHKEAFSVFFRPGRLKEQLKASPEFIETINQFIISAVEQCQKENPSQNKALDVFMIGLALKNYLRAINSPAFHKMLNLSSLIDEVFLPSALTPDAISNVYFWKFLANSVETPDELDLPTFLASTNTFFYFCEKESDTPGVMSELLLLFKQNAVVAKKTLGEMHESDLYAILDKTTRLFGITSGGGSWKSFLQNGIKAYTSNVATYDPSKDLFLLSSSDSRNSHESKLETLLKQGSIGKLLNIHDCVIGRKIDESTFTLVSSSYQEEIYVHFEGSSFQIQKEIRGDLYTLVPLEEFAFNRSFAFFRESYPDALKSPSRIWALEENIIVESEDDEKLYLPLNPEANSPRHLSLPLENASIDLEIIEQKAYSKKYPEYFLTADRLSEIPFPHIILKTAEGKRKLLVSEDSEMREFSIEPDGTLSPITTLDMLFYASFLANINTAAAHKILNHVGCSLTKCLSPSEKKELLKISGITSSPFLALKAFTILLEELLKFPPLGGSSAFYDQLKIATPLFFQFTPIYLNYLSKESSLDKQEEMLSKSQEIALLKFLTSILPEPILEELIQKGAELLQKPISEFMQKFLKEKAMSFLSSLHPIGSIEVDGTPLIPEFLLAFPLLKDRLESLEEGKLSKSTYKPKAFSVTRGALSADVLIEHINKYDISKKQEIKRMLQEAYTASWIMQEGLFRGELSIEKNFISYYELIQEASLEELKEIQNLFATNYCLENDPSAEVKSIALLLKAPKAYKAPKNLRAMSQSLTAWEIFRDKMNSSYEDTLLSSGRKESFLDTLIDVPKFYGRLFYKGCLAAAHKFAKAQIFLLRTSFHSFGLMQTISSTAQTGFRLIGALFTENINLYFHQKVTQIKRNEPASFTPFSINLERLEQEEAHLDTLLIESMEKYVDIYPLPEVDNTSIEDLLSDPEEKQSIRDYLSLLSQNVYTPKGNLDELSQELDEHILQSEASILEVEKRILKLLELELEGKTKKQIIQDITKKKPDIQSVLLLFLQGSKEAFEDALTLDEATISLLVNDLALYLTKKTNQNILSASRKKLKEYLEATKLDDPLEHKVIFDMLVASLQKRRDYPLTVENRAKLLFEACQGISLREGQVEKISLISEALLKANKQILFALPTGSGKTHAILPCSNLETSDGRRVTFNIFPQAIAQDNIESNKAELAKVGVKADALEFQRATFMSKETISYLHNQLLADTENRRPISTNAEAPQSLKLHFLSMLADAKDKGFISPRDEEMIGTQRKILRHIKTYGSANIDERSTLDPFTKLIYTRKEKETLPEREIKVLEEIFTILFEDETLAGIFIANKQHEALSKEDYLVIQRGLATHMESSLKIPSENSIVFRDYLLGNTHEMDNFLKDHPKKEEICLIRGILLTILPQVFLGQVNQQYGFSKLHRKEKKFAIPYVSSNEPKETTINPSEYQNRHETAAKTLVALFHEGLSTTQLEELLDGIKTLYNQELELKIPLKDSLALAKFRKIFNVEKAADPNILPENFIKSQQQQIGHKPAAILGYFRECIAPQITTYKETIVSTSSDFLKQFSSSSSMTATPQNVKAHGKITTFQETLGCKGFIPYHYFNNGMGVDTISTESFEMLITSCAKLITQEKHNALIDVGGLFRGHKNKKVAENLWKAFEKERPDIEEIVYFDEEKKEFMALNKKGYSIPIKLSKAPLSSRFTIFDKARTEGSDVKSAATASALVLFELDTTKSEAGQGNGRMRELPYGQKLSYAISPVLHQKLYGDAPLPLEEKKKILYAHLLSQDKKVEEEFNLEAIKQQIDADIHDLVLKAIYKAPTLKKAFEIFLKDFKELITQTSSLPSDLYGSIVPEVETGQELDKFLLKAQNRIRALHCLSKEEKTEQVTALSEYEALWKGPNAIPLPEKTIGSKGSLDGLCDVLLDAQQEIQLQLQVNSEVVDPNLTPRKVSNWSNHIKLFEKGWDKTHTLSKISFTFASYLPSLQTIDTFMKENTGKAIVAIILGSAIIGASIPALLFLTSWKVKLAVSSILFLWNASKATSIIGEMGQMAPPLFSIHDLAAKEFGKSVADQLFDIDLSVTNNLSNQEPSFLHGPQPLFTKEQKPAFQMLFVLDEENSKSKGILVDQNDTRFLREILAKDRATTEETALLRKRKVVLYDLYTKTIVAQGRNSITNEDLKQIPRFDEYIALGKLWSGRSDFRSEEFEVLLEKTSKVSKTVMLSIYQKILKDLSQKSADQFKISRIGRYLCTA